MQALSRNETAVRTRQEHKAGRHLARLPGSAHRTRKLALRLLVHRRRDQRGPDGARANGVHPDALPEHLVREAPREGHDGAFAGGVVEEVVAADVGVDGGAGDNGVAAGHLGEGVFGEKEEGVDVCVEGVEPLFPVLPPR